MSRTRAVIRASIAEILTGGALLVGWVLVTAGIASVTSPKAWWFSAGALFLSLAGWKMLWTIAAAGLYTLTRDKRGSR